MTSSSICFLSAVEMARLIREKKLSAKEVLDAHLRQIERINPKVNAIVTLAPEQMAMDGPLHGLPVAHKDLFDTAGVRTTYGSPSYQNHVPVEDDVVVERMRCAGAISVGKTNTPEFGAGSHTFNEVFGATSNPWDLTKTCGGSSGGSAVAVACGFVPIATGTDVGGSLRNPAAFCNVVGLRPSIGRVPDPKAALPWSSFNTAGCIARSVADLALGLSALAGPHSAYPASISEPGDVFARGLERSFKDVRIAWFRNLGGVPFEPEILSAINAQRATFESLGCIVEEAEPDFACAETAFRNLRCWSSAAKHGERLRKQPGAFKETLRNEIETGLRLSGAEIARAEAARGMLWRSFQQFLGPYEYFILPTTQVQPFSIETEYPTEISGIGLESYIDWMKSCWYISATGNPAISIPGGFTRQGLPVGLQIVGRHHADFGVLQLAHAFEQATGFGRLRPSLTI